MSATVLNLLAEARLAHAELGAAQEACIVAVAEGRLPTEESELHYMKAREAADHAWAQALRAAFAGWGR